MKKKFSFNFGFKDKASELVWDATFFGICLGFLTADLSRGSYVAAAIDIVLVIWGYISIKSTIKEVRAEYGFATN